MLDMHRLGTGQRSADGIGAGGALAPTGAGIETVRQFRLDKPLGAPRRQDLALVVGQHDQAVGIAQDVFVVGQHFLMGGLHQGMLAFQQLADAFGRQLVEARCALVVQAKCAATAPGILDKGVVSLGFGHEGDLLFIVIEACKR